MERITKWNELIDVGYVPCKWKDRDKAYSAAIYRLAKIENILDDHYDLGRLKKIVEADNSNKLAILDDPMIPMIQYPNDPDVYCPNCYNTLSNG